MRFTPMPPVLWIFAGMTILAVVFSCLSQRTGRTTLAWWMTGLGAGGLYLALGAEFLAIAQWMGSTLVALSLIFFAMSSHEGVVGAVPHLAKPSARTLLIPAVICGLIFAVLVALSGPQSSPRAEVLKTSVSALGLLEIGRQLSHQNLLSLEVLGLTLFLVIVGGGVTARNRNWTEQK